MITHTPQGLDRLLKKCHEHGIITIADEVMTGFGRTGELFACMNLQEKPDIICLSKGITGGFLPLGATACTDRIYGAFLSADLQCAFLHGHSYTANPLACSCACASLDLLLDPSCTHQRRMIAESHAGFCERWRRHPKLARCEMLGTILVLEYATDHPTYFSSLRDRLSGYFLQNGILLRPMGNVVYVMPPYCISIQELNHIYTHLIFTLEHDL
jgi:adenosylmethionine-8-amino-7-oxononanoate aminotransferase